MKRTSILMTGVLFMLLPIGTALGEDLASVAEDVASGSTTQSVTELAPLSTDDALGFDSKAMSVLNKAVQALGGESALRRHKHKAARGKFDVPGMIEGPFTRLHSAPNMYLIRIDLAEMGRVEKGFSGTVGWDVVPHLGPEPQATNADRLPDAAIDADYYKDLNYRKNHRSIKYLGHHDFDGKDCHEIRMTRHTGQVQVRYIDVKTYLPVARRSMAVTMMGPVVATQTIQELKDFDGEMIPTRYVQVIGEMQKQLFTITDVSFEPIDESAFAPPESITVVAPRVATSFSEH